MSNLISRNMCPLFLGGLIRTLTSLLASADSSVRRSSETYTNASYKGGKMEHLANISKSQVSYFESKDPQIVFSISARG